ncbi:hypothetical protein JYU29_16820 [Tianweitania sp. BSSL-BM11]|uniref:Uncharacterized protein n=1 Tax=Tianweitania aestuarii TaxID=2814886 RepID=A0ABS5RZ75_9HYPH|nr:hypothetical protein [Tianweitania aestuarii]MBS9722359.1 hypothetical protein [Tianweitania aestuarii]
MIVILLLIIVLVIAWPLITVMLGGVFWMVAANWELMLAISAASIGYLMFLSRMATKHNLKLFGKMGEPLDPTKPAGRAVPRSPETRLPPPFADRHREPEKRIRRFDER